MKPSLLATLLVLFFIHYEAQGIRIIGKIGSPLGQPQIHNSNHEVFELNPSPSFHRLKETNTDSQKVNVNDNLDVSDIAAMDYSFAKRKPPIHN